MNSKLCNRPVVKTSFEWVREAPNQATALIVAECAIKGRGAPIRRVALDWLFGERNKVAPLRSAAAKLKDTEMLSTAGIECERLESDGGMCLSTSERCQVRWTIRSIPVGILQCWAGFEDAITPIAIAVPEKTNSANLAPVHTATIEPLALHSKSSKVTAQAHARSKPGLALPVLAPMAALILNSEEAFAGNCAAIDGKFITDGRSMLLRSACDDKFLTELKSAKCGAYGPDNPVSEGSTRKLFDTTVQDAKHTATVRGYILGAVAGTAFKADQPFACILGPGDRVSVADAHRVRFIQAVTGATEVKVSVDSKSARLTFYRDREAVGILMLMESPALKTMFLQILEQERGPAQLPVSRRLAS
jgi:hypothetical protein